MLNCVPFNLMGRLAGSVSQTAYSDTVDIGYCDGVLVALDSAVAIYVMMGVRVLLGMRSL